MVERFKTFDDYKTFKYELAGRPLVVETGKVDTALVVHEHFAYETYLEPCIAYAYTEVDILTHHILKVAHLLVDLFGESHIKGTRAELFHHSLATTYAARSPE